MEKGTLKYQQGDVLLFQVGTLPDGCIKIKGNKGVLAEGETTGHAHRMARPVEMFQAPQSQDVFMSVPKRMELMHEEHATQVIEPGMYRVGRVVEYDYVEREARNVQD